jgi:hypothetical protein
MEEQVVVSDISKGKFKTQLNMLDDFKDLNSVGDPSSPDQSMATNYQGRLKL